jgi:hypothetical protein
METKPPASSSRRHSASSASTSTFSSGAANISGAPACSCAWTTRPPAPLPDIH